jgi:hypothetical protein
MEGETLRLQFRFARLQMKQTCGLWQEGRGIPMSAPVVIFLRRFAHLSGTCAVPNVTSIKIKGRRRRHRGEAAEGKEGDATLDLLLKHSDTTFITYI